MTVDPLLLTAARTRTFAGDHHLTSASGFFFESRNSLYLITSRHVVFDEPAEHYPDRLEIEFHTDAGNLAQSIGFSIPLYRDGKAVWRQAEDSGGAVDVAAIGLDRWALPKTAAYAAFNSDHLVGREGVEIGSQLLIVGFPMGFHDTWHHVPVVRHATLASAFGLRFQGQGYFLTDSRTHRGSSGAPVVMRSCAPQAMGDRLPWKLLGIHSAHLEAGSRDVDRDEALGLNCAWYSDVLLALTGK